MYLIRPMNSDSLRKVLELEARRGYADTAVIGGLDRFIQNWSAHSRSSINDPQALGRFRRLFKPGYAAMNRRAAPSVD